MSKKHRTGTETILDIAGSMSAIDAARVAGRIIGQGFISPALVMAFLAAMGPRLPEFLEAMEKVEGRPGVGG